MSLPTAVQVANSISAKANSARGSNDQSQIYKVINKFFTKVKYQTHPCVRQPTRVGGKIGSQAIRINGDLRFLRKKSVRVLASKNYKSRNLRIERAIGSCSNANHNTTTSKMAHLMRETLKWLVRFLKEEEGTAMFTKKQQPA